MAVIINPNESRLIEKAVLNLQTHVRNTAANQLLRYQNKDEFPKDSDDYYFFLRQGGRTIKRNFDLLQPKYIQFPNKLMFTRKDRTTTEVNDAVKEWLTLFNRRAPVGDGSRKTHQYKYKSSLIFFLNGNEITASGLLSVLSRGLERDSVIRIINFAPHSATIEDNWNQKGGLPGGVMYWSMRAIARKYLDLSLAYSYILSDELGLRYGYRTGGPRSGPVPYFLPMVEFGLPGRFPRKFVSPANNRTRRRTTRNRRGRF